MSPSSSWDPKISIVTVSYNGVRTIERTIESVLSQTYPDTEYIVIDGGSTDGTVDVIRRYADRLSCWVSEPDRGIYDAMNKGMQRATGDFIHFLNADDQYCDTNVLASLAPSLDAGRVCYGQVVYVDRRGHPRIFGSPFEWRSELRVSHVPQPALFVPLAFYGEVGGFDRRYRIAADYEMTLRLANRYPMTYVPIPVTIMHAGGASDRGSIDAFWEAATISRHYGRSLPAALATCLWRTAKWRASRLLGWR